MALDLLNLTSIQMASLRVTCGAELFTFSCFRVFKHEVENMIIAIPKEHHLCHPGDSFIF